MSEQEDFILACLNRSESIVDICRRFGISEKTGHKRLKRLKEFGLAAATSDQSRARLTHPYRISEEVTKAIIAFKRKHRHYGPKLIRDILIRRQPDQHWPAASSIGELLKRANLVKSRKRHHSAHVHSYLDSGRAAAAEPNSVWTADFKGEFRLAGSREYCYPLTVMDLNTRYLLGCTALASTAVDTAHRTFLHLFREYGLPRVIRTDNGVPFCQPNAIGRLGSLGFWWVRLGIKPEHTKPATPSENGAHERMHKTLKQSATNPSSASMKSQQRRFNNFTNEYNNDRPHSSLGIRTAPGDVYSPSKREYPAKLPTIDYPSDWDVRLVSTSGQFKWRDQALNLSQNLAGQYVGMHESAEGVMTVSYGDLELGQITLDPIRFTPNVRWTGRA
jgi:putative transposase